MRGQGGLPVCLVLGILGAHLFSTLPPSWIVILSGCAGLLFLPRPATRWLGVMLLASCWTFWHFGQVLQDRLEVSLIKTVIETDGVISSIPETFPNYTRFRFNPSPGSNDSKLPDSLLVYWYRDSPQISVGETWRLKLLVKPPWGRVNFQGGDRERWLFSERIGGLGTVRSGKRLALRPINHYFVQGLRESVREKISLLLDSERERGVVLALAIADRSGMPFTDRQLLAATGTSHLLAISGLHVGLAAVGGAWMARVTTMFLPVVVTLRWGFSFSLAAAILAAFSYASLAAWGVSTQRAVLMLSVAVLALTLSRSVHPGKAWLLALVAILAVDPLAPMGSGSWFSFLAVAALLAIFVPRKGHSSWWRAALLAQGGIMVSMLPLTVLWFQAFSPLAFFANLGAIPWVSLVVVPLTLAGVALLPVLAGVAGLLLKLAGGASSVLFLYLEFLSALQGPVPILPPPGTLVVVLAMLGGILLLLPAGIPGRWIGIFLLAPLFFPPGPPTTHGSLLIEALDTGQGMAVLLSTEHHTLLYDSGPGDGQEHNLVDTVIRPALAGLGRRAPERIIISHGDLDHAGGLETLMKRYPLARLFASLPTPSADIRACAAGLGWSHDGFEFEVLHPTTALPYLGNDSSCVLSVTGAATSVLFTGDISSAIENRLQGNALAPHTVLFVPHHGSKTSSSTEFINRVNPEASIATASLGNRFGFPRDEVRQRYIKAGSKFWSTGECGAVKVLLTADGKIKAESARRKRNRIWRWPAAQSCP